VEPGIFTYMTNGSATVFEKEPMAKLAGEGQIAAYKHTGFWKSMDTLKDKKELTNMWLKNNAPWALWKKIKKHEKQ
jgi:glucose-1-phosphate cytidylyltransferase